ncbi:nuclear transport factor 2 family protein [Nakamurella aerolata]|uniref:SnoaL-like domain-containing protein n=1 Tax=Nakamurella aerolata TaxID=1656892 RepID=A0A849A6G5_9ACTN|nr:nuclear transport factor 2 family protein [Nakamurella aerolata]NNG36149.1 SnoaL-like domain-containing protein [Nakamurella aerolata]
MTTEGLRTALADFNNGDAFFDHLADDVTVEFPYGPTLGLPARIDGKPAVRRHLAAVQAGGLTVGEPTIEQVTPSRYLAEYTGTYRTSNGAAVDVPLVAIIDHDATGIHRIREYWDTYLLATLATRAQ